MATHPSRQRAAFAAPRVLPGFLAAFAGGNATNLATSDARAVLAIAPTPATAAKLTKARIAAALRESRRVTRDALPKLKAAGQIR